MHYAPCNNNYNKCVILIVLFFSATIISNQDINILSKLTKPERRNGKLHWRNHGLTIFNLKDSYTSFSVTTVWSSQFEFPENTQLFSHIYWIQSEGEPAKPVEVEMQHCAVLLNKDQCSNMCFGVCNDPENGPPYTFKIQEGHFAPNSNYGKVEIKFSRRLIAIFVRFISRFLPENHQNVIINGIGKKYFTKWYLQNSTPSKGRAHFVICQNLDGCIEVCYSFVMNFCTQEVTIVNTCIMFTTNKTTINIANVNSYHNYNYT